jgi:NAD(P)-dependent dehydrogenase (short-subunit alcohol dehydrogenase family)
MMSGQRRAPRMRRLHSRMDEKKGKGAAHRAGRTAHEHDETRGVDDLAAKTADPRQDQGKVQDRYQKEHDRRPAQSQDGLPGEQDKMRPRPDCGEETYKGSGKLAGKTALITGGDSGIGRAVAIAFAREGADVAIVYLSEDDDARDTADWIEKAGRKSLLIRGDVGDESFCRDAVKETARALGGLNILVNNAAEQTQQKSLEDISEEQLVRTFRTNIFGYFFMAKAALRHLRKGDAIVNTTSVTAYRGSPHLLDYSSTKGAIVAFTRSLSGNLAEKGIRVNAVAPGPIWTPLIPGSFDGKHVKTFGDDVPLGRAGQPAEVAPAFVFLAGPDSTYMTGQVLHPNGGEIVNT